MPAALRLSMPPVISSLVSHHITFAVARASARIAAMCLL
jgi:hypothetical protein